jgi:hypothetical protein
MFPRPPPRLFVDRQALNGPLTCHLRSDQARCEHESRRSSASRTITPTRAARLPRSTTPSQTTISATSRTSTASRRSSCTTAPAKRERCRWAMRDGSAHMPSWREPFPASSSEPPSGPGWPRAGRRQRVLDPVRARPEKAARLGDLECEDRHVCGDEAADDPWFPAVDRQRTTRIPLRRLQRPRLGCPDRVPRAEDIEGTRFG